MASETESKNRKRIILMGEDTLINQLFAFCLERKLSISAAIYVHPIPKFPHDCSRRISGFPRDETDYLFLIDCMDRDIDGTVREVQANTILNNRPIALYNLMNRAEVETSILSKRIRGYFYLDDDLEIFLKGVKALFQGEAWISRQILLHHLLNRTDEASPASRTGIVLTEREQQVLSLVSVGVKNEEIAEKLCISQNTVKTHMYNIFKKIQVNNRLQASLWAAKHL